MPMNNRVRSGVIIGAALAATAVGIPFLNYLVGPGSEGDAGGCSCAKAQAEPSQLGTTVDRSEMEGARPYGMELGK